MPEKIFFTSDTHFGHDKDFVVAKRRFRTVEEMNKTIVENWNRVVGPEDTVYHLGDVYLNGDQNIEYVKRLNGRIHLIAGNHDTQAKIGKMLALPNVVSFSYAEPFRYGKWHFFLCHKIVLTCDTRICRENIEQGIRAHQICLHGHTHQTSPFGEDGLPYFYNVGVDAHNCTPISIDVIMEEIRNKHIALQNELSRHRNF